MDLQLRPGLSHNMAGVRRSSLLNPQVDRTAPQDPQSEGKSTATKENQAIKRKADSQGEGLDSNKLAASLRTTPKVESDSQEEAPMTGTSLDPAANFIDDQNPTNSKEQEPYCVDELQFESAITSVDFVTKPQTAQGWDTKIRLRGRSTYRLKKYYGIYWLEKLKVDRVKVSRTFRR